MTVPVSHADPVPVDRRFLDVLVRHLLIEFRDSDDNEVRRSAGYLLVGAAARGLFPLEMVRHLPRGLRGHMRQIVRWSSERASAPLAAASVDADADR